MTMALTREIDVTTALEDFVLACEEDLGDDADLLRARLRQKDVEKSEQVKSRSPGGPFSISSAVTPEEEDILEARASLAQFLKSEAKKIDAEDPSVGSALSDGWLEEWTDPKESESQLSFAKFTAATDKILSRGHAVDLAVAAGRTRCLLAGLCWAIRTMKRMVADRVLTSETLRKRQQRLGACITDDVTRSGLVWRQPEGGSWVGTVQSCPCSCSSVVVEFVGILTGTDWSSSARTILFSEF